jgi:hypothetical protein
MADRMRSLKLTLLGDVDQLRKSLQTANTDVEQSSSRLGDFSKKAGLAFAAAGVAAAGFAVKIGIDAVKAASDLSETISKVGVLFGDSATEIESFANKAASSLGQTKQQALDAAATFATFGKAAGLSGKDLSGFSTSFVSLASDLASFNNTSPEQAINAIGAALRGEAEPLRAYGVLLDDASLRQAALELGIIKTTKNALTPQQKVLAAQKLIFEQTGAAQGDFGRTSDGLANRTRILTAELENAKVTIGNALLPIILQLASFISENVIPIVKEFSESISTTLKPTFEGLSTYFTDILLPTFLAIYNFIKDFIFPIIAAVLKPAIEGLTTAFGAVTTAIKNNQTTFDSIFVVIKSVAGFVRDVLAPAFGTTLKVAFTIIGTLATGLVESFGFVVDVIIKVINAIKSLISLVQSNPLVKGIGNLIENAFGGKRAMGGPVVGGNSYLVGERGAELFTPSQSGTITPNNRLGGNTINITVNGAIDSEGTARQIINVLNNSFYRGTSGAAALVTS